MSFLFSIKLKKNPVSEQKTIFEGLYQIDWANIRHIYDSSTSYQIPHEIRNLLSSDAEIRYGARGFLFGAIDERGIIDDATFYILPFVLEILALAETPDKLEIVECLYEMISQRYGTYYDIDPHPQYKAIYEMLESHIPRFLSLFDSSDEDLQVEILRLLEAFKDASIPFLVKRFGYEQDSASQIAFLKFIERAIVISYSDLRPNIHPYVDFEATIRSTYISFFWKIFQQALPRDVRYAAAQSALRIARSISLFPVLHKVIPVECFLLADSRAEKEEVLSSIKLLPNSHTIFKIFLKEQNLEAEDRDLIMNIGDMRSELIFSCAREWVINMRNIFLSDSGD